MLMRTARFAWMLSLLAAAGCSGLHPTSSAPEPFFFIQMSDPQFGMFTNNKDFTQETELFTKAIAEANRLKPAFVVITGDLTHAYTDDAQTAEFFRIANQLDKDIPLHLVSGNHDVTREPSPETLAHYRKTYGQDWYTFEKENTLFIVLNSTIIETPDHVQGEFQRQQAWLEKTLAQADRANEQHIIACLHHPLPSSAPKDPQETGQARKHALLKLLAGHGVGTVLSGHFHRNQCDRFGGTHLITTASTGKCSGGARSGFRVVKVWPDRIEHRYYALDKMPEAVVLEPAGVAR